MAAFRKGEPVSLTRDEFHYAFANTLSREESNARYAVPAAERVLREHAFASFRRPEPSNVGVHREGRAPLLFIGFGEDHVMPPKLVLPDEETDASSITEFVEFPGRPHFPGAPGWEDVADYALGWAVQHASQWNAPADASAKNGEKGESS